MGLPIGLQ